MHKFKCPKCKTTFDSDGNRTFNVCTNTYTSDGAMVNEMWCSSCTRVYTRSCDGCNARYDMKVIDSWLIETQSGNEHCRTLPCTARVWICACTPGDPYVQVNSVCSHCHKNQDGMRPRCRCGRGSEDNPIHEYNCQPNLVFHDVGKTYTEDTPPPTSSLFMGFELETEITSGLLDPASRFARARLQTPEIAQLKHDGSISNGFEIVTQPHTYEQYRNQKLLWDTIKDLHSQHGARSWDPGNCGFHIHIGRAGFKDNPHKHRFVEFVYQNSEMMMKFGGRRNSYAQFDDVWGFGEYDQPVFTLEKKGGEQLYGGGKMYAVNCSKPATLELRFMRGTTKIDTILSYLGMAHAMVMYTKDIEATNNGWWNWDGFVKWVDQRADFYPELISRMPGIKALTIEGLNKLKLDV